MESDISGSIWDFIAPVAGAALGSVVPGVGTAIGAAVGSGLGSGIKSGDPLTGLLSAGGSYVGGNLGSSLLGDTIGGTVGSGLADAGLGFAGNVLPSALSGSSLAGIAGSSLGSSLGESLGQSMSGPSSTGSGDNAPAPWSPKRETELSLPGSLSGYSGLSPIQIGTNLATQGVYGGGQGPGEQDFFLNMANRRLVDDAGNVDSDFSDFAPIETSYLDQLGYGGNKTPKDLLQALSGRFG